jgi:hypothetical protein
MSLLDVAPNQVDLQPHQGSQAGSRSPRMEVYLGGLWRILAWDIPASNGLRWTPTTLPPALSGTNSPGPDGPRTWTPPRSYPTGVRNAGG